MPTPEEIAGLANALQTAGLLNVNASLNEVLSAAQGNEALNLAASWHAAVGSDYVIVTRAPEASAMPEK